MRETETEWNHARVLSQVGKVCTVSLAFMSRCEISLFLCKVESELDRDERDEIVGANFLPCSYRLNYRGTREVRSDVSI